MTAATAFPERIVCLTEETTETLYLLGEERRIVGISGFTVRPPRARREKPRVSAFLSAHTERILALEPDLVLEELSLRAHRNEFPGGHRKCASRQTRNACQ